MDGDPASVAVDRVAVLVKDLLDTARIRQRGIGRIKICIDIAAVAAADVQLALVSFCVLGQNVKNMFFAVQRDKVRDINLAAVAAVQILVDVAAVGRRIIVDRKIGLRVNHLFPRVRQQTDVDRVAEDRAVGVILGSRNRSQRDLVGYRRIARDRLCRIVILIHCFQTGDRAAVFNRCAFIALVDFFDRKGFLGVDDLRDRLLGAAQQACGRLAVFLLPAAGTVRLHLDRIRDAAVRLCDAVRAAEHTVGENGRERIVGGRRRAVRSRHADIQMIVQRGVQICRCVDAQLIFDIRENDADLRARRAHRSGEAVARNRIDHIRFGLCDVVEIVRRNVLILVHRAVNTDIRDTVDLIVILGLSGFLVCLVAGHHSGEVQCLFCLVLAHVHDLPADHIIAAAGRREGSQNIVIILVHILRQLPERCAVRIIASDRDRIGCRRCREPDPVRDHAAQCHDCACDSAQESLSKCLSFQSHQSFPLIDFFISVSHFFVLFFRAPRHGRFCFCGTEPAAVGAVSQNGSG